MPRPAFPNSMSSGNGDGWSKRIQVLVEAALELSDEHDLDIVLARIVRGAAQVADAHFAALGIYDEQGRMTRFVHHGVDEDTMRRLGALPQGRGLLGEVLVSNGPIRLADIAQHPESVGFPPGHPPMRSFLGVPVIRGGRRHGNLYVTEKVNGASFDDDDETLMVFLAAFATGAIESALLVEAERSGAEAIAAQVTAEERGRARHEMLGKVIDAQEAERARVSRDLHDDIGQALTSVLLGLRLVEGSLRGGDPSRRISEVRELVSDALQRSRRLASELRPTVLDDIGLVPALERLTTDLGVQSGLAIDFTNEIPAGDRLTPAAETVAYRVTQEALTNIVRHAEATEAQVSLRPADHGLRLVVTDNGRGFDTTIETGHLGLAGMAERAELAGGNVTVTSRPGHGTNIALWVPVD